MYYIRVDSFHYFCIKIHKNNIYHFCNLRGESCEAETQTVADTAADSAGDGWCEQIQDAEDCCGTQAEEHDFFGGQLVAGQKVCNQGNG